MKLSQTVLQGAAAVGWLAAPSTADFTNFFRTGCATLTLDRIDPLVEPGVIGSAHLHQIVGGDALNATMDPADRPADQASCTSCTFVDDFSNYWTPSLFYQARNGSFKRVRQKGGLFFPEVNGGIVVYYFNNDNNTKTLVSFPQGFRMRHGDPAARGPEGRARFPNITSVCRSRPGAAYERQTEHLPKQPCEAGMMTRFWLPQCWDGKNLDSPDHASHVNAVVPTYRDTPTCPLSHPVMVPQMVVEIDWETQEFNDPELWGWRGQGKQPFVWSNGDREGWSLHIDYIFGWKGNALQRTLTADCDPSNAGRHNCGNLATQEPAEANKCVKKQMMQEETEGWLDELPGGNKVWE